jgi:ribose transport system substrate-binding protein
MLHRHRAAWRIMLALALVAGLLVATACGDDDDGAEATTAAATSSGGSSLDEAFAGKTIAYIQTGSLDYYNYSAEAAKLAIEQLGGTADVYNSQLDPQKELANVQNAIAKGVDGVVLFPVSAASEKSELRLLKRAGIPTVVLYGYDPSLEDEAAAFIQADFEPYTEPLGAKLNELVPTGKVAEITGLSGRADVEGFSAGFRKGLGDSSRIVEKIDAQYLRQKAFNATRTLLTKHPDLKAIFVHNEDMAVGVVRALGPKVDEVAVVSQNGSPPGIEMLKEGKLKATVGLSPTQEGAMAVKLLAESITGQGPPKLCYPPHALNTPEQIDSFPWEASPENVAEALKTPCS